MPEFVLNGKQSRKVSQEVEKSTVNNVWLSSRLKIEFEEPDPFNRTILVLDCRTAEEFAHKHVTSSHNVTLPSILYKRLLKGSLSPFSVVASQQVREWFSENYRSLTVVLIPETPAPKMKKNVEESEKKSDENVGTTTAYNTQVSSLLLKLFVKHGCTAYTLKGCYSQFFAEYPQLCSSADVPGAQESIEQSSCSPNHLQLAQPSCSSQLVQQRLHCQQSSSSSSGLVIRPSKLGPLIGLQTLRLEDSSSSSESCYSSPDSGIVRSRSTGSKVRLKQTADSEPTTPHLTIKEPFRTMSYDKINGKGLSGNCPVEILPYLYLGNASNATDRSTLDKHGIRYILNVTPNLPNTFEKESKSFKYLQIPIDDHWSQNLATYFPAAIAFIDEARSRKCGVLVHCLAGISRSVTVTVAYLMQTLHKSLDDAYELVKAQKPNISPNFNFMGQLLDFERQLHALDHGSPDSGRSSCACGESACDCSDICRFPVHFPIGTASQTNNSLTVKNDEMHFLSPTTVLRLPPLKRPHQATAAPCATGPVDTVCTN